MKLFANRRLSPSNPSSEPAEVGGVQGVAGASSGRCPFKRLLGSPASIANAVREQTKPQHLRAEHHPVQQASVRGKIDRHGYAQFAAQMRHVHDALEAALDRAASRDARVSAVFSAHHRRLAAFDADLQLLDPAATGRDLTRAAAQAEAWLAALETIAPTSLLGVLYVLEGSTNGGQFIAPVLRRSWGLQPNEGLQSLDPHGERTRELWQEFRAAIDGIRLSDAERSALIAAAAETFDRITEIMDEVSQRPAIAAVTAHSAASPPVLGA